MGSYYEDVYRKRLNRYGYDYQTRTQGQRERFFENLLLKSIYRLDFEFGVDEDGAPSIHPGVFEPHKQNDTKVLHYLLTHIDLEIPNGTVLELEEFNKSPETHPWLVYYLEKIRASGYNRYIMLRMTHKVKWIDREGNYQETWSYFYGQEDNMLKDELKSRSRSGVLYNENLKTSFFVCPTNPHINKEDYFELDVDGIIQGYRVTGFDIVSTPGVEYVTVDPVYRHDLTPAPKPEPGDDSDDYFWLQGEVDLDGR